MRPVQAKTVKTDDDVAFYNSLDGSYERAWALIEQGVVNRKSGFHTLSVSSITQEGTPTSRIVVLRGAERNDFQIRFHTDNRSRKTSEFSQNPNVCLLFYDARLKTQLRLDGIATVHKDTELRENAWKETRPFSRICYRVDPGPGVIVDNPLDVKQFPEPQFEDHGYDAFTPVTVRVSRMEWLYLAAKGHRRAEYDLKADGTYSGRWVSP